MPQNVILVHTPQERAAHIAAHLMKKLDIHVMAPRTGDIIDL